MYCLPSSKPASILIQAHAKRRLLLLHNEDQFRRNDAYLITKKPVVWIRMKWFDILEIQWSFKMIFLQTRWVGNKQQQQHCQGCIRIIDAWNFDPHWIWFLAQLNECSKANGVATLIRLVIVGFQYLRVKCLFTFIPLIVIC